MSTVVAILIGTELAVLVAVVIVATMALLDARRAHKLQNILRRRRP